MAKATREEIASYRVGTVIGESAMGTIHRGYDRERDRVVLIAVAHDLGADAGHTRRMRREAVALFELRHPNVVSVIDVGVFDSHLYVVVEHVDGAPLDDYIRDRALTWRQALALFSQAARGLAAAHGRAIVHGALGPGCIKVDAEERVRITDFAIARPRIAPGAGDAWAPELEAGAPATIYSDQYAFAHVLSRGLEHARRGGILGVPRRVRRAIGRALEPEPRARFSSMHELVALL